MIVDDLEIAVQALKKAGYPEILRATLPGTDLTSVFVDSVKDFGHFVEVYAAVPLLVDFYKMVADASVDFDGREPVRQAKL
jgi:hypothetical protein